MLISALGLAADKPNRKKPPETNPDGVENIEGAIVEFAAVDSGTGRTVGFRFRSVEGVLYDLGSPARLIGTAETGNKGHLRITFNNNSPLPGTYKFMRQRKGHWNGDYQVGATKWALRLAVVDR
jgi:hypothetical protein